MTLWDHPDVLDRVARANLRRFQRQDGEARDQEGEQDPGHASAAVLEEALEHGSGG
jgi:hypothetical protein